MCVLSAVTELFGQVPRSVSYPPVGMPVFYGSADFSFVILTN